MQIYEIKFDTILENLGQLTLNFKHNLLPLPKD